MSGLASNGNYLPGKPAEKRGGCGIGCLALVGGAALIVGLLSLSSCGSGSSDDSDNKYEAIAQCEDRIKEQLKAPATASFSTSATGSGTWTVTGTVDAENSFGANIRNDFQCTVVIRGDSATTTIDLLR